MANVYKVHSYSQLIVKDLDKAYFLPYLRSSYCKGSRLYNDNKYMYFDYALRDTKESDLMRPIRHLATIGDAIPSLSDIKPDALQSNHWKTWLPVFPAAKVKSVEDGFADDIPVVTTGPLQSLPAMKHVIDPDLHNELLLKSTIPRIGVPNPRLMKEENVTFPCMLKVDQSGGGCGNWLVRNSHQLKEVVAEIRNKCNWKGKYILQEYIPDAVTMGYYFYVFKSGYIHWLGSLTGADSNYFNWTAAVGDWTRQEKLKEAVYEEFILPVKNFLHSSGYFGIVNIEILEKNGERHGYLVDLNCRLPGALAQLLISPYMAKLGYPVSLMTTSKILRCTRQELFAMAEKINESSTGKVIVLAAAHVDGAFRADLALFAETMAGIELLMGTLEQKQ